jgi:predicted oxidoreductase
MERILQAKDAMQIDLSREDFYILWSASNGREVA